MAIYGELDAYLQGYHDDPGQRRMVRRPKGQGYELGDLRRPLARPQRRDRAAPLVPLSKLSATVQGRWREYLAWVASHERPMNGVKMGSGKLAPSIPVEAVVEQMAGAVSRGAKLVVSKSLSEAVKAEEPWTAAGVSRAKWYRDAAARKKAEGL